MPVFTYIGEFAALFPDSGAAVIDVKTGERVNSRAGRSRQRGGSSLARRLRWPSGDRQGKVLRGRYRFLNRYQRPILK